MKRPVLYILIPFCLGIAFSGIFDIPILCSILLTIIALAAALIFSQRRTFSHIALSLAVLFAGMALSLNSNILPADHISGFLPSHERNDTFIRGTVIDDPLMSTTAYKTLKTDFTLKADFLKEGASWRKVSGLVRVNIFSKKTQALSFGSEVILEGTISKPYALSNPGIFNYAEYLELKGIHCCLNVKEGSMIEILKQDTAGSMKSAAYKVRHRLRELIDEYLQPPYSGFLKAILIGDRTGMKESLKDDFIKTGTVHVMAGLCTKPPAFAF